MYAIFSLRNYVLHGTAYLLTLLSVFSDSFLGSELQNLTHIPGSGSAAPPISPCSPYFTELFPTLLGLFDTGRVLGFVEGVGLLTN